MGAGSCLCQQVKYTFTDSPISQVLCHCRTCRKVSGSTNTTLLIIPRPTLAITTVPDKPLSSYTTLHESGLKITLHRCVTCGTGIYKQSDAPGQEQLVLIFAGTVDGEEGVDGVVVNAEFWVQDRVGWLGEVIGAAQCQKFE